MNWLKYRIYLWHLRQASKLWSPEMRRAVLDAQIRETLDRDVAGVLSTGTKWTRYE